MPYSTQLFPAMMREQAREIVDICARRHLTIATAESCTGGLLAALITEIPGASQIFTHGFITYANPAKTMMIDVSAHTLETYGAVSEEIARAMAQGALKTAGSSLAIGITGIAGPSGATAEKPVGLVHIACAKEGAPVVHEKHHFKGERTEVRLKAVEAALILLLKHAMLT